MDLHDETLLSKELRPGLAMLWIESPSNPTLRVYDIQELSDMAHRLDPDTIVVVDNTFASPFFQNPLDLGADIVIHSTTKYIGGHSDVIGGALVVKDKRFMERLNGYQRAIGAIPGPFDAFLTLQGASARSRSACKGTRRMPRRWRISSAPMSWWTRRSSIRAWTPTRTTTGQAPDERIFRHRIVRAERTGHQPRKADRVDRNFSHWPRAWEGSNP